MCSSNEELPTWEAWPYSMEHTNSRLDWVSIYMRKLREEAVPRASSFKVEMLKWAERAADEDYYNRPEAALESGRNHAAMLMEERIIQMSDMVLALCSTAGEMRDMAIGTGHDRAHIIQRDLNDAV